MKTLNFKFLLKVAMLCTMLFSLASPELALAQAELDIPTPDYLDEDADVVTTGAAATLQVITIVQIVLAAIITLGGMYIIWNSFAEYRDSKLKLGEFLLHSGISLGIMVMAYFVIIFLDDIVAGLAE